MDEYGFYIFFCFSYRPLPGFQRPPFGSRVFPQWLRGFAGVKADAFRPFTRTLAFTKRACALCDDVRAACIVVGMNCHSPPVDLSTPTTFRDGAKPSLAPMLPA
jgi:hypothetical protein